jgi:hypothetical protein
MFFLCFFSFSGLVRLVMFRLISAYFSLFFLTEYCLTSRNLLKFYRPKLDLRRIYYSKEMTFPFLFQKRITRYSSRLLLLRVAVVCGTFWWCPVGSSAGPEQQITGAAPQPLAAAARPFGVPQEYGTMLAYLNLLFFFAIHI